MRFSSKFMMFLWFWRLLFFLMDPAVPGRRTEQRVALKFLVKSGQTPIECWHALTRVFGTETMCKTQVRHWHKKFREGQEVVKDDPHPGRARSQRTPEKIQLVRDLLADDAHLSVRELADRCEMSTFSMHQILRKDLQLTRKCAKFVPRILTEE